VSRGVAPRRSSVQVGTAVHQKLNHIHIVVVLYKNNSINLC
jgi:hypothetical protein